MQGNAATIGLFFIVACGGGQKSADGPGGVGGDGASKEASKEESKAESKAARSEELSLEFVPSESSEIVNVWLTVRDENGSTQREEIGTYAGQCRRLPIADGTTHIAGELLAADCRLTESGGVEIRLVQRRGVLVVLDARYDAASDERLFEQRREIPLPSGATISASPLDSAEGGD